MKIVPLLVLLQCMNLGFAQDSTSCICCESPYNQFLFWEGDWIVTSVAGDTVGTNSIVYLQNKCILQENWEGKSGGTGSSFNYFDKQDSTWNQVWVDNKGGVLNLKGTSPEPGKMVMKSDYVKGKKWEYYNEITWELQNDGTVSQIWVLRKEDGEIIQTLFHGIYHRDLSKI